MTAKKTKQQFIREARQIHGSKYDYNQTMYVNNKTNVTIICPEHGPFEQTPDNHLHKKGCRRCGVISLSKMFIRSRHEFIEKARIVHSDFYKYDLVDYTGAKKKVAIICPEHGNFMQTPDTHISGGGCRKCRDEETGARCRSSAEIFIKKSKDVHGNLYDYSEVVYQNAQTPVKIRCEKHGWFEQAPGNHLRGAGCPKCAIIKVHNLQRKDSDLFISEARAVHGDRYDYSLVQYNGTNKEVEIVCRKHGEFRQKPVSHLKGHGCNECGNENSSGKQKMSVDEFIMRARETHGNFYDYSLVDYKTARSKVKIICPLHGIFEQQPDSHINQKSGCSICADEALPGAYSLKRLLKDKELAEKDAILYYLYFSDKNEVYYKVGITQTSIKVRYSGHEKNTGYKYQVLAIKKMRLLDAFKAEQFLIEKHAKYSSYKPKKKIRKSRSSITGHTECFSQPLPKNLLRKFFGQNAQF
jgi:hypothetical protein